MKQTITIQAFCMLLILQCGTYGQNLTTDTMASNRTSTDEVDSTTITSTNVNSVAPMHTNPPQPLTCEKRDRPYFLPHIIDISKFYVCVKGHLFMLNCPSDFRFDSEVDQCTRKTPNDDKPSTPHWPVLIPHETNCGWYYVVREITGERVLNSCPMPQLFDIHALECKNYTEVKCKNRFEPKDACDYQIRTAAHAYPCSYLPSCKNRTDGLYPDRLRDCRMYFRCTSERSSESWSCTQNTLPLGERFSYEEQRCLPAQYVDCLNDEQKPIV